MISRIYVDWACAESQPVGAKILSTHIAFETGGGAAA
jgi:hypothetical protein